VAQPDIKMVVARRLPDATFDPSLDCVFRARGGDGRAFAQLVKQHEHTIYSLVLRVVRNPDDARDVVQDVWMRVALRLPQLREPERFTPWLRRIARNCALDFYNAKKSRPQTAPRREEDEDAPFDMVDATPDGPEQQIVSLDERRKVWETLGGLSEADRTILYLREHQDLPYAEIAKVLAISSNAAEVRVFRARERFRKLFTRIEEAAPSCNVSPLQLSALINGDIGDASRIMLERHVDTCEACTARLRSMETGRRLCTGA
jgi:RNA polymerase sigma-70 factor (ECF subfamily)